MENGHVENLDFFDLDLYNQDKESLDSQDEELDLDKYEVRKDSLNIYEEYLRKFGRLSGFNIIVLDNNKWIVKLTNDIEN